MHIILVLISTLMTDLVVHSMMQLPVLVVFLVGRLVDASVQLQPITPIQYVSNAAVVPSHFYWINHGPAASPRGAVSRETLEEHSGEGIQQELFPDISEEQAHLDPDDTQVPSRPSFPSLPGPQVPLRPRPQVPSLPRPQIPSLPRPQVPSVPTYPRPSLPPVNRPSLRPDTSGDPGVVFDGPRPDGSYDFSYSQDDQSRSEKGDSQGNVQGSYSYTGPDGKVVTITYTAGAGTGYVPVGEGLLPPPEPSAGNGDDNGSDDGQNHLSPGDDSQTHLTPDDSQNQQPGVSGGEDDQQPEGDGAGHKGMPYSYNYDAHASSKTETADDNGNVKGSYWYLDGAGANRTVTYTVNGNEGFIAKEDVSPGAVPVENGGTQRSGSPNAGAGRGGRKGGDIPSVPVNPPNRGQSPPVRSHSPSPPVKGGHNPLNPSAKGNPPVQGVKGGAKGGAGWDKYPLGK